MKKIWPFIQLRKRLFIIGIVVLVIGFIVWKIFFSSKSGQTFQTDKVTRGSIVSTLTESGQVLNTNTMVVTTQASGVVDQIYVQNGQTVKKGDKIMDISLDTQGQQRNAQNWASYLQAKTSLANAQANMFSTQSTMFNKWNTFFQLATNSTYQNSDGSPNTTNRVLPQFTTSQDDWLAAEAQYKNQQDVVNQTQASLNNAWVTYQFSSPTVMAPMDGMINNITVIKGMVITNTSSSSSSNNSISSQQVAVIQNQTNPIATFNLSDVDVIQAKSGQKATLTLDSLPGKTFTGTVMSIDRIGSITSGVTNYPVIIQFDTEVPQILPNMAVNANIITATKNNVLLVPTAAIQTVNSQTYARVLQNNKETQVAVQTGLSSDTQTEVTSGLTEGQTVITGVATTGATTSTSRSIFSTGLGGNRSVGR
jgi:RND family efflux transporter MFP subunit